MTNIENFLRLACIVPLLNIVMNLIKLAQAWDVFVIDLVEAIKLTQAKLHEMFLDPSIAFKFDSFVYFNLLWKVNMGQF